MDCKTGLSKIRYGCIQNGIHTDKTATYPPGTYYYALPLAPGSPSQAPVLDTAFDPTAPPPATAGSGGWTGFTGNGTDLMQQGPGMDPSGPQPSKGSIYPLYTYDSPNFFFPSNYTKPGSAVHPHATAASKGDEFALNIAYYSTDFDYAYCILGLCVWSLTFNYVYAAGAWAQGVPPSAASGDPSTSNYSTPVNIWQSSTICYLPRMLEAETTNWT
jgi:hypothetical protein